MNIIITYYSDSGSTAKVAQTFIEQNNVSYVNLDKLTEQNNLQCDLLIIGSPNKYGKLVPGIITLLRKHRETLSKIPVIIYFTCMDFCMNKKEQIEKGIYVDSWFKDNIKENLSSWDKSHSVNSYIKNIEKLVPGLNIQSLAFFKGKLNFKELPFFDALVMRFICFINKNIKAGDYLKQEDINNWIKQIQLSN